MSVLAASCWPPAGCRCRRRAATGRGTGSRARWATRAPDPPGARAAALGRPGVAGPRGDLASGGGARAARRARDRGAGGGLPLHASRLQRTRDPGSLAPLHRAGHVEDRVARVLGRARGGGVGRHPAQPARPPGGCAAPRASPRSACGPGDRARGRGGDTRTSALTREARRELVRGLGDCALDVSGDEGYRTAEVTGAAFPWRRSSAGPWRVA